MPQLMPFMWIVSIFMFMWIMLMLIEMYYYKDNVMVVWGEDKLENNINYMW